MRGTNDPPTGEPRAEEEGVGPNTRRDHPFLMAHTYLGREKRSGYTP